MILIKGPHLVAETNLPSLGDLIAMGVALLTGGATYGTLSQRIKTIETTQKAKDDLDLDREDEMKDVRERMVRVEEAQKYTNASLQRIEQILNSFQGRQMPQSAPKGQGLDL
jgi:hypothetical protein